jgi:hypothetical protein
MNSEDPPVTGTPGPPRLGPASSNELGQAAHDDGYYTQSQAEASTWPPNLPGSQKDHQSLGAPDSDSDSDSQQVDLQAAIYAAKGKAKEARRVSDRDTASLRDVGNAAQPERELQPTERSLDPGDTHCTTV